MVFRYFILFIIVLLSATKPAFAGIDPGRVAAIELASDQAKKTLKSQEKAQLLMTTGHADQGGGGSHDQLPAGVQ